MVWRSFGRRRTIRSTCGWNPMSSMRSASSSTRIWMPSRSTMPRVGKVVEAARRRDQHVGAIDALGLLLDVRAAVDRHHPHLRGAGDRQEVFARPVARARASAPARAPRAAAWTPGRVGRRWAARTQGSCRSRSSSWPGCRARIGRPPTPWPGSGRVRSYHALPVPRRPARRPRVRESSRVPRSPVQATAGDYSSNAPSNAPTRCDTISSCASASASLRSGSPARAPHDRRSGLDAGARRGGA